MTSKMAFKRSAWTNDSARAALSRIILYCVCAPRTVCGMCEEGFRRRPVYCILRALLRLCGPGVILGTVVCASDARAATDITFVGGPGPARRGIFFFLIHQPSNFFFSKLATMSATCKSRGGY